MNSGNASFCFSSSRSHTESESVALLRKSVALLNITDRSDSLPMLLSYNDRIRPLLDAVDRLRHLMVMKEGIPLPTIVVVGDQSSGKSSVLESLAGISLPRGQGICTRVPLIMRLQHHPTPEPELSLEFNGKIVHTDETHIADAIVAATDEIAGDGKGISNTPLTLTVKKNGVPDLTMVDLPGITRVPVHGQPENIYEQISEIIMEHIRPEESIILNVLSAAVDFTTCESIRMSQQVDKNGERTLAVVTKADKHPEGLLEKVTANDVNIGLGFVCVRNRIGDESYEEARKKESWLFATHSLLSKIDISMVGIPVLAQKLVQIQATIIARCLPEIVRKINDKLSANISALNRMPKKLSSTAEVMTTFMEIVGSAKESLRKILLRGEFEEYPDDLNMHCTARLVDMLSCFSNQLHNCSESDHTKDFLKEEIRVLEEAKAIELPNFLPRNAFLTILQMKVQGISSLPISFVERFWNYIENVVVSVLLQYSENYNQLQVSTRRAGQGLIARMKEQSINWVTELIEMEKLTDYTCNPMYIDKWNLLMAQQNSFIDQVQSKRSLDSILINELGVVTAGDVDVQGHLFREAFDLRMRITAYWKIVLQRLVDSVALHLQHSARKLVNKEMEKEIFNELMGAQNGQLELLLEESPAVASNRKKLSTSIKLLRQSKDVLANIMDNVVSYSV